MSDRILLNCKEIENLSAEQKIEYYEQINRRCSGYRKTKNVLPYVIRRMASKIRPYDFEIIGIKNIPSDNKLLFGADHCNTHDFLQCRKCLKR